MIICKATLSVPSLPSGCSLTFPTTGWAAYGAVGQWNGKRVYIFPGLDAQVSDNGATTALAQAVSAAGSEAIVLPVPVPVACFFSSGGWQYRDGFVSAINSMMNAVESSRGAAAKSIAGGISYGGLHSMMAAASNGRFAAWFSHLPVTRIDALAEFPLVGDVPRFNPFFDSDSLAQSVGWISWGTADTRVNGALTKSLAQQFSGSVSKVEYVGQDHSTNPGNIADMVGWISTL